MTNYTPVAVIIDIEIYNFNIDMCYLKHKIGVAIAFCSTKSEADPMKNKK